MVRPVHALLTALAIMMVLVAVQVDVAAKKKVSRRKARPNSIPTVFVVVPKQTTSFPTPPRIFSAPSTSNNMSTMLSEGHGPTSLGSTPASATPGGGAGDGSGKRAWGVIPGAPNSGALLISEFRVRGPNGANDEFIEIYNDF